MFCILVPAILGCLLSVIALPFYRFRHFYQHNIKARASLVAFTGGLTALIILCIYAWLIIELFYAFSIDSAPNADIKVQYSDEAVLEAWWQTMIPLPFRKPCYSNLEIVCSLAKPFSLDMWNLSINYEHLPWLSALISGVTSSAIVWGALQPYDDSALASSHT